MQLSEMASSSISGFIRREPSQIKALDTRLRGYDDLFSVSQKGCSLGNMQHIYIRCSIIMQLI